MSPVGQGKYLEPPIMLAYIRLKNAKVLNRDHVKYILDANKTCWSAYKKKNSII